MDVFSNPVNSPDVNSWFVLTPPGLRLASVSEGYHGYYAAVRTTSVCVLVISVFHQNFVRPTTLFGKLGRLKIYEEIFIQ